MKSCPSCLNLTRYQVMLMVTLYCCGYQLFCPNQLFAVFANILPEWQCSSQELNVSSVNVWSRNCTIYYQCPQGNLSFRSEYKSMALEFGLVCDMEYVGPFIATLSMLGIVFGSVIFGHVSDWFGRRTVCIIADTGMIGASLISSVALNWQTVAASRFAVGAFIGGYVIGTFTLCIENLKTSQRMFYRTVFHTFGPARAIYAVIAYLTRTNWRLTFLVVNLIWIIPIYTGLFFAREPVRWLLQKGRASEANKVFDHINKINGHRLGEKCDIRHLSGMTDRKAKLYGIRDLLKTATLRRRTVLACAFYFTIAFVGHGIELQSGHLPGNIYVIQIVLGIGIAFGKPWLFLIDNYIPGFNRRLLHQLTLAGIALCLAILAILGSQESPSNNLRVPVMIVFLLATVIVEWQWDAQQMISMELFPTVLRSTGYATSAIVGRIGGVLAPQVVLLSSYWKPAMYCIFTAVAVVAMILSCCFLPETKDKDLPDTIELNSIPLIATSDSHDSNKALKQPDCEHEHEEQLRAKPV